MNSELFALRKFTLNPVGNGAPVPNCASDFRCAKMPRIITKKQTCFQRFYLENRSARLLHKRLAARDGRPVPYIISFQHSAIFGGTK